MQVVIMALNDSTFIIQWIILFSLKDNVGGYQLYEMLMLWALAVGIYGVSHTFFENIFHIPELITNGKLDVYLTQPKNVLFSVAISKTKPSALGDLLYATILILIVKPEKIFIFTTMTLLGAIISTAFSIIIGSFTFWLKKGDALADNLNNNVILLSTYTDGIFKGLVKWLLYTIIPVGFMVYVPIKVILSFDFVLFVIILSFAIFITMLAFFTFNKGLKRYSSSSLMSARV